MSHFDLVAAARQEMIDHGFDPDFPPGTNQQIAAFKARPAPPKPGELRDLRGLPWSSIDNDTSRDLDQAEVAERAGDCIRIRIAIADVDYAIEIGSPIDRHAASQTTTIYTGVKNFSMLPDEFSTDMTSLNESGDRMAVVTEMVVARDGTVSEPDIYRAWIRNHAQLAYNAVGAWLEGTAAAPPKVAAWPELQAQLKLQNEAAQALRGNRHRMGSLDFDRIETEPVLSNGQVTALEQRRRNLATELIEDFMIGANQVMAQTLTRAGVASIRRVVRTPERWERIVALAGLHGTKLPDNPDSGALNVFLQKMRETDPIHYPDISLAVIKLMGPGEYVLTPAGGEDPGHFALAVRDYSHSTAPNRRFADMVTQRLIKSVLAKRPVPYSEHELGAIADNCTLKEAAERKVVRKMEKRIAAVVLIPRIGECFKGVVTGNTPKGVFVRVLNPPAEGILMHAQNADVGDKISVKLTSTDPRRGYIDFVRC